MPYQPIEDDNKADSNPLSVKKMIVLLRTINHISKIKLIRTDIALCSEPKHQETFLRCLAARLQLVVNTMFRRWTVCSKRRYISHAKKFCYLMLLFTVILHLIFYNSTERVICCTLHTTSLFHHPTFFMSKFNVSYWTKISSFRTESSPRVVDKISTAPYEE